MEHHDEVKRALGGHQKEGKRKLHVKREETERADNGGFHRVLHFHDSETGEHHHTEHHILPDTEAANEHFEQHMGDQPAAGEVEPDEAEGAAPPPGGGEAQAPEAGM